VSNVRDHRDLRVWQAAIELGIQCYEVSRTFPREERYGLTAQIRSAAVSVAANIAEGNGRLTIGEYSQPSVQRARISARDWYAPRARVSARVRNSGRHPRVPRS